MQILYDLTYMWNPKTKKNKKQTLTPHKPQIQRTDWWLPGGTEMDEGGQRVQTCSFYKLWGCDEQHGDYSTTVLHI